MADRITREDVAKAVLDEAFLLSAGGTSLSDIANALGIKKASLYNHFESREDLFAYTIKTCADYFQGLNFIPQDIDSVVKKYSAGTVFKGIVSRYVKMHEKSPLFQIYTFVESQKYFLGEAAKISCDERTKIATQTKVVLNALFQMKKISIESAKIPAAAEWFCAGLSSLMSDYLLKRKEVVMNSPRSGDGELFSIPADEKGIDRLNSFVESFIELIA